MASVAAVLLALPEEEASDFIFGRAGVVLSEFGEDLLRVGDVVVVLLAGVPLDRFAGLVDPRRRRRARALGGVDRPGVGAVLVAGVDLAFEDVPLAARRQEVPAQAAVADAALE